MPAASWTFVTEIRAMWSGPGPPFGTRARQRVDRRRRAIARTGLFDQMLCARMHAELTFRSLVSFTLQCVCFRCARRSCRRPHVPLPSRASVAPCSARDPPHLVHPARTLFPTQSHFLRLCSPRVANLTWRPAVALSSELTLFSAQNARCFHVLSNTFASLHTSLHNFTPCIHDLANLVVSRVCHRRRWSQCDEAVVLRSSHPQA